MEDKTSIEDRRRFLSRLIMVSASSFLPTMATPAPKTSQPMETRPKLLLFDVNETLLDLSPLTPAFEEAYQEPKAFKSWFSLLLQYSLVTTVITDYKDFSELGKQL